MPLSSHGEGFARFYAYLVMILLAMLGILMVSTLRYSSMKTVGTGRRNLYLVLVIAAIGMLMWLYSQYVLLILSVTYVSHGIIWYIVSMLRPRRIADEADEPAAELSPRKQ
jgi:CDP-diacylglycerol--serine O-phosphatidyltransferase